MTDSINHGVCVVTQPLSEIGENTTYSLVTILSAITSVSLIAANISPDSKLHDVSDVIEVSSRDTGTGIFVPALRFLRNQIRMGIAILRIDEEIILFFGTTSYLFPIIIATLSGKTVVLQPRGDVPLTLRLYWEQRVPRIVARLLAGTVWLLEHIGYRLADAIITYTPSMATELGLRRFEGKLYMNGARYVDTNRFFLQIPYEDRGDVIGYLGRLDEEKGIRTLARVAKQLPADMTFVFAGDGDLFDWLGDELSDEIESGSVELTGWIDHDEVPDVLNHFKLLVLPSQPTEGLPTVILEAMACGTPVYATPVSGVPDVVREGETGFLMTDMDSDAIISKVEEVLGQQNTSDLSHTAKHLIEERYSFEAAKDRYAAILIDIAS